MKKEVKKLSYTWNSELAYAVGLITTDGNLSSDGRHISFSSKDLELVKLFRRCLGLKNKIGQRVRGSDKKRFQYVVQFGSKDFYGFLLDIGLMQRKSERIYSIEVPDKYFFDFLRGHFDGDGSFYSYHDPRWPTSYCFFLNFASRSEAHIYWLRGRLNELIDVSGHVSVSKNSGVTKLRYGKKETILVARKMYDEPGVPALMRKRLKIREALYTIGVEL